MTNVHLITFMIICLMVLSVLVFNIVCVYIVKAPQLPFDTRLCSHVTEQVILCNDMIDNLLENGV